MASPSLKAEIITLGAGRLAGWIRRKLGGKPDHPKAPDVPPHLYVVEEDGEWNETFPTAGEAFRRRVEILRDWRAESHQGDIEPELNVCPLWIGEPMEPPK